jgi:hypothetical protein
VIGWKQNRWVESDGNRHLNAADNGTFAPGKLIRARIDIVYDGIQDRKSGVYHCRVSAQAAVEAIPRGIIYLHIAW